MQFFIKKIGLENLEGLRRIARETFDESYRHMNDDSHIDEYMDKAFSKTQMESELADSRSQFYFAWFGDSLAGYMKINEKDAQKDIKGSNSIEIERCYIKSEFQGQGLGRALLEEGLKIAEERNKRYVYLGVWEKNKGAIVFYEKMGFYKYKTRIFWMGQEKQRDYIMRKTL